ncbi:MAG: 2-amino-4-hydroxy-6-hydroxymethyldihydropteridine diphosphokinase [Prevotella sp.]|nr:2-amino-4-hydroxy-6-hydroxymethyldihydropteridine diphosphokinase [Prevotella sp.]
MEHKVYLGLGSNLGNREVCIERAVDLIAERVGPVVRRSSLIETEPWGFDSPNKFLNGVVLVETTLSPREVLEATQRIERLLGRRQKSQQPEIPQGEKKDVENSGARKGLTNNRRPSYKDRPIDIDILLYDELTVDEPGLKIPHPLMHERDFVMIPLKELLK